MAGAQLNLLVPEEATFGRAVAMKLKDAKRANPTLGWDEVAAIIEREREAWFPSQRTRAAKKDELFLSLVRACEIEPAQLTGPAARLAAVSLAHIKQATPNADRPEIERRVRRYRSKFPGAAVTPRAISLHWASLAGPPPPPASANIYAEPAAWKDAAAKLFPGTDIAERAWSDLPPYVRTDILKSITT